LFPSGQRLRAAGFFNEMASNGAMARDEQTAVADVRDVRDVRRVVPA
jgi:hypothetical protein